MKSSKLQKWAQTGWNVALAQNRISLEDGVGILVYMMVERALTNKELGRLYKTDALAVMKTVGAIAEAYLEGYAKGVAKRGGLGQ